MNTRQFLAAALALDAILAGAVVWLVLSRPVATPSNAATTAPALTRVVEKSVTAPAVPAKPPLAIDWRVVESEDYRKYIANLRAIGCPEETIRDIITADVNKLFDARRKALTSSQTNKFEFWKSGNFFARAMDQELIEKQQALAKEKRALLTELLGVAPEEKPDLFAGMNPFEQMLDFLPSGKQTEVMELFQKYQSKMMRGMRGGAPDSEDMKQFRAAQKEMETELAKVLSPQELEDYQLRLSQTSMMMRSQLAGFDPSEQEFRDIFKMRKQFDDEYGGAFGVAGLDKAEREKRDVAKKDLDARVKETLGDTRYAEYERSQDWAFQGMSRVAERNGLGKDAAVQAYDIKKVAEQEAARIRQDTSLNQEQRETALRGIRSATENTLRTVFTEKGFDSYQNQQGANWINRISPAPKSEGP